MSIDEILTKFYKKTLRADGNTPTARAEATRDIKALIFDELKQAEYEPFEFVSRIEKL
jgi:hypothetical protein